MRKRRARRSKVKPFSPLGGRKDSNVMFALVRKVLLKPEPSSVSAQNDGYFIEQPLGGYSVRYTPLSLFV
uniref:Calpain_III domain-containing protein n=1 Tax=Steinernema glaseri TaxID=37863 RepID=A0A1I8AM46_9BILA